MKKHVLCFYLQINVLNIHGLPVCLCKVVWTVKLYTVVHRRGRKVLENRNVNDEERIVQLEKELEETIMLGEESDRKFEEVSDVTYVLHSLTSLPSDRTKLNWNETEWNEINWTEISGWLDGRAGSYNGTERTPSRIDPSWQTKCQNFPKHFLLKSVLCRFDSIT